MELLKAGVQLATFSAAVLPPILPPDGLTAERVLYLYKNIREHVDPAFQDDLCPPPTEEG